MQAPIPIRAILLTSKRIRLLERCLASLVTAAKAESRIALSLYIGVSRDDDSSRRSVADWMAAHAGELESTCVVLEPGLNPGGARNRLLAQAVSTQDGWILFVDDDVAVPASYFTAFCSSLQRFPKAVAIGGPNLTPPEAGLFSKATGLALSSRLATFHSANRYRAKGAARLSDENELILCNLFVLAKALSAAPFPEDFLCAEENWMLQALSGQGRELVHDPLLYLWHERRDDFQSLARQVFKYGCGRGQNLRARPETLKLAYVLPGLCVLATPPLTLSLALPQTELAALVAGGLFVLYALLSVLASAFHAVRSKGRQRLALFALTALLFPIIHVAYGLGILWGLRRGAGQETA